MLKKMIAASAVILALMLSGCGDTEGEAILSAQNAVDTGDAATAIAILEAKTNRTDDENALLAEAYASQAGFSMIDITIAFIDASENTTGEEDMVNLVASLIDQASDTAIDDLNKSISYYEDIPAADRTDDQNFKLGMTYIVQLGVMVDADSPSADIVTVATNAFDALGAVIPDDDPDLQQSYTELQAEISSGGSITTGEIDQLKIDYAAYIATL
jgi:hypothetical protein